MRILYTQTEESREQYQILIGEHLGSLKQGVNQTPQLFPCLCLPYEPSFSAISRAYQLGKIGLWMDRYHRMVGGAGIQAAHA